MSGQEVRYCTTADGVRLAYSAEGEGPPLLVFSTAFAAFSLLRELPSYDNLMQRLGEGRRLIRFDTRGIGLSEREVTAAGADALVLDPLAVLDALGLERASVLAAGPIGGTALYLAARHSRRIAALVLFGSMSRVPDRSWYEAMIQMLRGSWQTAARSLAGGLLRHPLDDASKMADIYLKSTTGEVAARYMEDNINWDLTSELGSITARTLVIHSQDDALYPFSAGQEIAAGIHGARLLPLEGNYSIVSLGDKTDLVVEAIVSFLDEDDETRAIQLVRRTVAGPSGLRTVLFTDLVGHTEMMQRLGDARGREVLREHERITRETLRAHGGTEIKTDGDSFMVSFGSVTKAVECAVALQRAFAEREGEPMDVRIGLNAGEPIEEDGDLFGATVILASRIAAKAEGGEILVADTVRGLCSGKGFLFSDRGEFVAKGIEEPVRIYEVNWRQ
ncbi:MAG: adenylate/guanylate cyclase domain-containing protein [Dehalococcoidia bacterium]